MWSRLSSLHACRQNDTATTATPTHRHNDTPTLRHTDTLPNRHTDNRHTVDNHTNNRHTDNRHNDKYNSGISTARVTIVLKPAPLLYSSTTSPIIALYSALTSAPSAFCFWRPTATLLYCHTSTNRSYTTQLQQMFPFICFRIRIRIWFYINSLMS